MTAIPSSTSDIGVFGNMTTQEHTVDDRIIIVYLRHMIFLARKEPIIGCLDDRDVVSLPGLTHVDL